MTTGAGGGRSRPPRDMRGQFSCKCFILKSQSCDKWQWPFRAKVHFIFAFASPELLICHFIFSFFICISLSAPPHRASWAAFYSAATLEAVSLQPVHPLLKSLLKAAFFQGDSVCCGRLSLHFGRRLHPSRRLSRLHRLPH